MTLDFTFVKCMLQKTEGMEVVLPELELFVEQFEDAHTHVPESLQSKHSWMLRAVHMNLTCLCCWVMLVRA